MYAVVESGSKKYRVSAGDTLVVDRLDVEAGKDVIIDNTHVVCWDSTLRYEVSVTTASGGGLGGMIGNLVNSAKSGEGIVLRFSGSGKICVCSRNRDSFAGWVRKAIGGTA